jgi:lysophospholipase L1-like esterase
VIRRLRLFFTFRPGLRALLVALVPLAVFAILMEFRIAAYVAGTTRVRGSEWTEFRPHPTMFWRLRPNLQVELAMRGERFQVTTNSQGIRSPEVPFRKGPRTWRAWCLGDSITYGYGVDDDKTYESRLQDKLQRLHPDRQIQVLNGGCPGWTSFQARELTRSVGLKYQPDLYILGCVYADPAYEDKPDSARVDSNPLVRWFRLALFRSEFYMFLRQRVVRRSNPEGLPPADYTLATPRVPPEEYRQILNWFVGQARAGGGHVVFLNLGKRDPDPHPGYDQLRRIAQEVSRQTGNAWVDIDAMFKERPDRASLFSDRIHPNVQGFELMAEALARAIEEKGWIP